MIDPDGYADFAISDYLDDEKVIDEYLLAAADDPNPEVLSRAKSDVEKARDRAPQP
jgi:DNA-binding phage protein